MVNSRWRPLRISDVFPTLYYVIGTTSVLGHIFVPTIFVFPSLYYVIGTTNILGHIFVPTIFGLIALVTTDKSPTSATSGILMTSDCIMSREPGAEEDSTSLHLKKNRNIIKKGKRKKRKSDVREI